MARRLLWTVLTATVADAADPQSRSGTSALTALHAVGPSDPAVPFTFRSRTLMAQAIHVRNGHRLDLTNGRVTRTRL